MTFPSSHPALESALSACGLVAILRGVKPDEVAEIGQSLYEAGFRLIEVPMNSPEPLKSIATLRRVLPDDVLIGAGTVLSADNVLRVADAGGQIIVMPHSDATVIRAARDAGMAVAPGVATPTEAFAALAAGAHLLKLFPAELLGPAVVKAWRAVLPRDVPLVPVGGITPDNMAAFVDAGAQGFGLGSALYRPGLSAAEVGERARGFMTAWRKVRHAE